MNIFLRSNDLHIFILPQDKCLAHFSFVIKKNYIQRNKLV